MTINKPLSFTFDTNCIIAVDENREDADAIRTLCSAHIDGVANVAVVAISASEHQKDGHSLETFDHFTERLNFLGMGKLEVLEPMLYWDVTFWDHSLWSDDVMALLERAIHEILFPNIEFSWAEYKTSATADFDSRQRYRKWVNAKCDVQAFWSHAFRSRDVFVTSDKNFHLATKKPHLLKIAGGKIELPADAVKLIL